MFHQRSHFVPESETQPSDTGDWLRHPPARKPAFPPAWWVLPAVIAGAGVWSVVVTTVVSAALGGA
jgi:hypothetical protein